MRRRDDGDEFGRLCEPKEPLIQTGGDSQQDVGTLTLGESQAGPSALTRTGAPDAARCCGAELNAAITAIHNDNSRFVAGPSTLGLSMPTEDEHLVAGHIRHNHEQFQGFDCRNSSIDPLCR